MSLRHVLAAAVVATAVLAPAAHADPLVCVTVQSYTVGTHTTRPMEVCLLADAA